MRGKFVKKIECPKGYVNIDEISEALGGIEKEEDYEYGDYGEVLSKWGTCDYGDVLEAIYCCDVVKAVTLDRIKQAREEMHDLDYLINDAKYSDRETRAYNVDMLVTEFYEIMDKLIAESEN